MTTSSKNYMPLVYTQKVPLPKITWSYRGRPPPSTSPGSATGANCWQSIKFRIQGILWYIVVHMAVSDSSEAWILLCQRNWSSVHSTHIRDLL